MDVQEPIYAPSTSGGPLRQGEILSDVVQAHLDPQSVTSEGSASVFFRCHPFCVVMTQDCDLEQDFKARQGELAEVKRIPNVLFCEATTADDLLQAGRESKEIASDVWKRIRNNKDERYQYLREVAPEEDAQSEGLPALGMDFKRYFALPTEELYIRLRAGIGRRCRLVSPYVEHLCTRFYYFQLRIALPQEHFGE